MPWCRHDNQHILNWAAEDVAGFDDLDRHLDWLWDLLAARGFPVERIPRNVELAADVLRERGETDVAEPLAAAAGAPGRRAREPPGPSRGAPPRGEKPRSTLPTTSARRRWSSSRGCSPP